MKARTPNWTGPRWPLLALLVVVLSFAALLGWYIWHDGGPLAAILFVLGFLALAAGVFLAGMGRGDDEPPDIRPFREDDYGDDSHA